MGDADAKKKTKTFGSVKTIKTITILNVIATVLATIATMAALCVSWLSLETTRKTETTRLLNELVKDFESGDVYHDIRTAVEACVSLDGRFDHDERNQYLNFLERLAYLRNESLLDLKHVDYFFGGYIVEAHEHLDFQKYIKNFQIQQPAAFEDFNDLFKQIIEKYPDRRELAKNYRLQCPSPKVGVPSDLLRSQ